MITNTIWGEEEISSKICIICGEEKSLDKFYLTRYGKKKKDPLSIYKPECKKCDDKLRRIRKKINNEAPPKPTVCECCGKDKKLVTDHNHITLKFRGWLCHSCNTGIGKLGDNLEGLMQAINYLKSRN